MDFAGGGVEKGGIEVDGVSAWVVVVAAVEGPVDAGEVSFPGVGEEEFCGGRRERLRWCRFGAALAVLMATEEAPDFVHVDPLRRGSWIPGVLGFPQPGLRPFHTF